jgi:hypothetical protein
MPLTMATSPQGVPSKKARPVEVPLSRLAAADKKELYRLMIGLCPTLNNRPDGVAAAPKALLMKLKLIASGPSLMWSGS